MPWSEKISHVKGQLSLQPATTESTRHNHWSPWSAIKVHCSEELMYCEYRVAQLTQLEKAPMKQRRLVYPKVNKSLQITSAGEGVEKRECSYTPAENVNWCSQYGKQYGTSSKKQTNKQTRVATWSSNTITRYALSRSVVLDSLWLQELHAVHQAPLSMGILQARILEWVAMPSSRGSLQLRVQT